MITMEKNITVSNRLGVHGRVATRLAQIAGEHAVLLHIVYDDNDNAVDCSSVLDVLSMAFTCGTTFTIRAAGEKTKVKSALAAVEKMFADGGEP